MPANPTIAPEPATDEIVPGEVGSTQQQRLREALTISRQGIEAFLNMVNVMQKFQALPIPSIIETAQHNCPIIIEQIDAALRE